MAFPIAAALAGAGSIIGGATGGKGAKKAAQIQAQTAREQIAAVERNRNFITGLNQPTMDRGNAAGGLIGSFLGTEGGDQAADALATYRGSTGYQDLLNTGLGAVNSNAYARGMGASGATLKALQAKGMSLADQNSQQWLSNLGGLATMGQNAVGQVAGASSNATNAINGINQNTSDAQGNAALISGSAWQRALQNLTNVGGSFAGGGGFASSYAAPR